MASSPASGVKVYIPITDDITAGCTSYYNVQWRYTGTMTWNMLSPPPVSPLSTYLNPSGSPAIAQPCIIIPLLVEGQDYDLQIQRFCCDGSFSTIVSTIFST